MSSHYTPLCHLSQWEISDSLCFCLCRKKKAIQKIFPPNLNKCKAQCGGWRSCQSSQQRSHCWIIMLMSCDECGNHLLMLKMIHVAPSDESTVLSDLLQMWQRGTWRLTSDCQVHTNNSGAVKGCMGSHGLLGKLFAQQNFMFYFKFALKLGSESTLPTIMCSF